MTGLLLELCKFEERIRNVSDGAVRTPAQQGPLRATFRCEGDLWTLVWNGPTKRIRKMNGLAAIAHLLARPNQDIHVVELSSIVDSQTGAYARNGTQILAIADTGDAGPALDLTAKQAYRR